MDPHDMAFQDEDRGGSSGFRAMVFCLLVLSLVAIALTLRANAKDARVGEKINNGGKHVSNRR